MGLSTTDIPGVFLQTKYDKGDMHINMEGSMVALLEGIDMYYYRYSIYTDKRRRRCMYAESKKAIYGTLEASLLFWGELSKILE